MGDISVKTNLIMDSPTTKSMTSIKSDNEKGDKDAAPKSPARYEYLKQRKLELEKKLNEKYSQLQQVVREEAHIIGLYPSDDTDQNGNPPTLRRKIGTSFKLPENLLNNKEDDINKLLLEKQIQQQISEASLRLANDNSQSKSIRRTHKQSFESAQQKLLAINQNLSVLKKRQQMLQKPTSKDDIDLHKTANFNRMRSNSNSSGMLSPNERRSSIKSTTSSNQSVQIMSPQQLSPYSIINNNSVISLMPSGSQTMTPAASAAMVSQLNMLKQRSRHESFSNYINYDINSNESVKSPIHSHHHHYKQSPTNRHQMNYRNSSYSPPPPLPPQHYNLTSPPGRNSPHQPQHFVYDNKIINRLQQHHSNFMNDQNYCPNTLSPTPSYDVTDKINHNVHSPQNYHHHHHSQYHQPSSHHHVSGGLGGYWMTLDNNEKVWCAVERKQQNPNVKLQRNVTSVSQYKNSHLMNNQVVHHQQSQQMLHHNPTKATSLGSFEVISKYDDTVSIGQASISTTLSGGETRKREKVWRETSLDGPPISQKTSTSVSPSPSSISIANSNYQHHQPLHHNQLLHINTSFGHNSYNHNHLSSSPELPSPPPPPPQPIFHQQQLLKQQLQHQQLQLQQQQLHRSSIYADHYSNLPANYYEDDLPPPPPAMLESPTIPSEPLVSPTTSVSSGNTLVSPTQMASPATVLIKSADIQTESPKNVTVVEQGKIMPYKEVTKPFEMSDFYKYSTKFRQKQQLQQQSGSESPISNNAPIQKIVYQPPNPTICQPLINNYN